MDKKTSLPDGVTCPTCERRAKFSAWLFAHWNDEAIHTCACGTRLGLRCGVITFLKPPRAFHLTAGAELDDFGRRYRTPRRAGEPVERVYADRLQSVFTEATGLDTHL